MNAISPRTAIIGGTGLQKIAGLKVIGREVMHTPFGEPSAPLTHGEVGGARIAFLPRHGHGHTIPPHLINYPANIYALRQIGVNRVMAINAVGAIDPDLGVPALLCPDQLIDYTYDRFHSFEAGRRGKVRHIDFSEPYSSALRAIILKVAADANLEMHDGGTYGITQGPRLETAAEITRLAGDGCHVVGMTGMPEAALAREIGLEYAVCAVTVNRAAGLGESEPNAEMATQVEPAMALLNNLLAKLIPVLGQ